MGALLPCIKRSYWYNLGVWERLEPEGKHDNEAKNRVKETS